MEEEIKSFNVVEKGDVLRIYLDSTKREFEITAIEEPLSNQSILFGRNVKKDELPHTISIAILKTKPE